MEDSPENNVFIYNRSRVELTGIKDVCALSDEYVEMTLEDSLLCVDGKDLKIDSFSSESGKIKIFGKIEALTYIGKKPKKKTYLFNKR